VYDWRHPLTALLSVLLMEFGDFAILRRMLRGIKARAESLAQDATQPTSDTAVTSAQGRRCHGPAS